MDGAATFQLEPILKKDPAYIAKSIPSEIELFHRKDVKEPKERSRLRSGTPTFQLEEISDHPADTERTFDCVSIFILRNFMLG